MSREILIAPDLKQATRCHSSPFVFYRDSFLSPVECEHIINMARGRLKRARVSLDTSGDVIEGRTGFNCWLAYESDLTLSAIGTRVAEYLGLSLANAEAMQVIYYNESQEYRPHYDAYDLSTVKGKRCSKRGGQRLITALGYLNTVPVGGETRFPKLDFSVAPVAGRMVFFQNTDVDTSLPAPLSLHAGMPVKKGEKWAFNIWFHAEPVDEEIDFTSYKSPTFRIVESGISSSLVQQGKLCLITNRAQGLFQQAVNMLTEEKTCSTRPVCFTYWDTYGNNPLPKDRLPVETKILRLLPRKVTNRYSDKRLLPRIISEKNLSWLAPKTFTTKDEALAYDDGNNGLFFAKSISGTGGQGMFCVRGWELAELVLPANYILQEGITDLKLIDSKKFTTRIYAVIWNGGFFLYPEGFVVIHGAAYDPDSTDYSVQIDHRGYHDDSSAVSMDLLSNQPEHDGLLRSLAVSKPAMQELFSYAIACSDENTYVFLGMDLMLTANGDFQLIEVNTAPNFIHNQLINQNLNVPFFKHGISLMLTGTSQIFF